MTAARAAGDEKAWLSVVVSEDLKVWVRVKAASASKSTSAYIRELLERDRLRALAEEAKSTT